MPLNTGAGDKTRTYDLMITNQLLYQLSYTGLFGRVRGLASNGNISKSGLGTANKQRVKYCKNMLTIDDWISYNDEG